MASLKSPDMSLKDPKRKRGRPKKEQENVKPEKLAAKNKRKKLSARDCVRAQWIASRGGFDPVVQWKARDIRGNEDSTRTRKRRLSQLDGFQANAVMIELGLDPKDHSKWQPKCEAIHEFLLANRDHPIIVKPTHKDESSDEDSDDEKSGEAEEPENVKPEKSESAREAESAVSVVSSEETSSVLYSLIRDAEWREVLKEAFKKPYIGDIEKELEKEKKTATNFFPPRAEIFTALNITPLSRVKVVLIGQDPYAYAGQAHGLCFSVKRGVKPPPSLKNIYKELATDIEGFKEPDHGFLESWARQGIVMLNASLTVRAYYPNSHSYIEWETLTDRIVSIVSNELEGVVFLLCGMSKKKRRSRERELLVDQKKHTIINTAHPLSPDFMGCKCFSKVNEHLLAYGKEPINWGDL